ncbi:MAG: S-layer homology domain-containing protein, partial [Thermoanaerobaculia bacterium]
DNTYRWMGSIAQDASGDIALGFSASSDGSGIVQDPSVHYTGRLVTDPLGDMSQGEGSFLDSTQPFGGFRWGDYSTMVVDPTDQCTFWYTTMYGAVDWKTRIGSFKFPSCTSGPTGTLEGHVTDVSNGNPIAGATVAATGTAGTITTFTDASGHYAMLLPVDTYDMTVTAYGYLPGSATGEVVTDGGDTIQDFALDIAPVTTVSGTVTDGSGQSWPLYAKLVITAPGAPTFTLYTDPITGVYSKDLVQGQGITYTFTVNAAGYNTATAAVFLVPSGPSVAQDFSLTIDAAECSAPGYSYPGAVFSDFSDGVLPPGWSVVNNSGQGAGWYIETGPAPCGEFGGNRTGGEGPFAVINSDCDGQVQDDAELRTPSVDMSSITDPSVRFNLDYYGVYTDSVADVDISTNGGSSWTNVFEICCGSDRPGPASQQIDITGIAAGRPSVMARFHYTGFFAWWWQVDNVLLGSAAATCQPGPGGLVIGNVRAANTTFGFNGAAVTNTGGLSTTTFATPKDPNQDDGFYVLFAPPGAQTLHASLPAFADDIQTPTVVAGSVIRQDFSLRFLDVPDSSTYANFIYGLVGAGITAGCGGGNYCPDASVTRAQMAVFIEKAKHGPSFVPPACTPPGIFGDVACPGGFAVNFIEALFHDGIAAGCSVNPLLYCPSDPVTRAQMAVFIERGVHGSGFVPPAATGIFTDVPPGSFAAEYIEALYNDGIAAGCGGGNYCPNDPVTRAQMAVFIDVAFHVPHL